ncbi:MAG: response regulator [Candidatus Promineifilaceae bacterium]
MKKILLIDDDRTNASLIKILLEMDGFKVDVCPDLNQARKAISTEIDAFIIDCNLALGDNGIDLLIEIREGMTEAPSSTPVIMTSGDDRRLVEAENSGATQFLLKPYSPSKLSDELTKLTSS